MELAEKLKSNLVEYTNAVNGITALDKRDLSGLDKVLYDAVQNGKIQKFEYCTELAWKLSKIYLEWRFGVIAQSPKQVYRELLANNFINENEFFKLYNTIEDRNQLSHIYKEEMFENILKNLHSHISIFLILLNKFDTVK